MWPVFPGMICERREDLMSAEQDEAVVRRFVEEGRISASWTVSDSLGLMQQLGLTPQPEDSS